MKVLKVVPMGYRSAGSVRVFLLLGDLSGGGSLVGWFGLASALRTYEKCSL